MNISTDVLKMLYQQNLNPVNTSSIENTNGITNSAGVDNSFLRILNEVISKNDKSNLVVDTSEDKKELNNNELSLAFSLLMQQITGRTENNLSEQYQIDEILNTLQNSDSSQVEALTGISDNLSFNSGVSNIDKLIESLQALKQSKTDSTQGNTVDATNSQSVVNTVTKTNRSFPKEIMDSINAARQAYEIIQARIVQIRDFTGRANVEQVNASSNIEELLAKGLTTADLERLKVSLVLADGLSNVSAADSILDIEEIESTDLINSELLSAEAALQNTEVNSSTSNEKSRIDIIDESIINANVINTKETQADSKVNKIEDDLTSIKERVFEQIKDNVSTMRANDKQAVTMHLKPEELGKLDIKMVLENGNLSIEILTSNTKAHSLILSSIPELENILKNSLATDKNFMDFENAKQLSEENARQSNQGYNGQHSQQQEQNDNKNGYEEFYTSDSDNSEKLDFYTAFSRIREAREQILSKI